jgi:hypothetical protein
MAARRILLAVRKQVADQLALQFGKRRAVIGRLIAGVWSPDSRICLEENATPAFKKLWEGAVSRKAAPAPVNTRRRPTRSSTPSPAAPALHEPALHEPALIVDNNPEKSMPNFGRWPIKGRRPWE